MTTTTKAHGDHDPLPYDGHNADLAHLCQVCGEPMPEVFPGAMTSQQMQEQYEVKGFAAPFVHVVRKSDGVQGTLTFQHRPRFYFDFMPYTVTS